MEPTTGAGLSVVASEDIELAGLGVLLSPLCPAPSPEEQAVTAAMPRKVTDATSARVRRVMDQ